MAWKIELAERPLKTLRKLDRQAAERIVAALDDIARLENPRSRGKALSGSLAGLWRYRVDDWRIIAKIEDERLIIIVIAIGNRREVYR